MENHDTKTLEEIYEETFAVLELTWGDTPCPDGCKKPARTHNINIILQKDGSIATQPVCRYGKDGKLKEVWRKAAGADKQALRETFLNIVIDEKGKRIEDFIKECNDRVTHASGECEKAHAFVANVEARLRTTAESLGIATSDGNAPYGAGHLLRQIDTTVAHLRKRSESDQKSALDFYNRNQALERRVKELERTVHRLTEKGENGASVETKTQPPKLRVVGTPPPIPTAATETR